MAVVINSDLDRRVAHLLFDVHQRLILLNEETGERVSEIALFRRQTQLSSGLAREIDAPALVVLRGRQLASYEVPLHLNENPPCQSMSPQGRGKVISPKPSAAP